MATYVVGDVQGCYQSLKALLSACQFRPGIDTLIFAGDLIARGPDSLSVMQWVLDHTDSVSAVLGNHDLHFLSVASDLKPVKARDRTEALLESSELDAVLDWYRRCPLTIDLPELDACVVHAGIWPGWDRPTWTDAIDHVHGRLRAESWQTHLGAMYGNTPAHPDQITSDDDAARFVINAATRMRFVKTTDLSLELTCKESPSEAPEGMIAWMDADTRTPIDRQIFFGHWATLNGHRRNHQVYALDTGCVYGGLLSMVRIDDRFGITVDCVDALD